MGQHSSPKTPTGGVVWTWQSRDARLVSSRLILPLFSVACSQQRGAGGNLLPGQLVALKPERKCSISSQNPNVLSLTPRWRDHKALLGVLSPHKNLPHRLPFLLPRTHIQRHQQPCTLASRIPLTVWAFLQTEVQSISERLTSRESSLTALEQQMSALDGAQISYMDTAVELQLHMEDLEDQSCRINLRLRGLEATGNKKTARHDQSHTA